MTSSFLNKQIRRILSVLLCLTLMFMLSSCLEEEPEPEPVIQIPYFVGAVLYSAGNGGSQEYKEEIEKAFSALETESARYELSFLYSEGDQLKQEHDVSYFIAQGVDVIFVQPMSYDSTLAVHDLIIDSGGTYGVFIGGSPADGALDEKYIFCWSGESGKEAEITAAAEAINELVIPAPEVEEGDAEGEAEAGEAS